MRILSWNCNNGIGRSAQIAYFKSFKPDIAIVPELKKSQLEALSPDSHIWVTNNHSTSAPKGLGVLAYNGYKLAALPRDEDLNIFVPLKVARNDFSFNMLAVWNFTSFSKEEQIAGDGAIDFSALEQYRELFADPFLMAGEWNMGPTLAQQGLQKLLNVLNPYGVKSLYDQMTFMPRKEITNPAFRAPRNPTLHLDHMFGSSFFCDNASALNVDTFEHVVLSDHAPLVLDVDTSAQLFEMKRAA